MKKYIKELTIRILDEVNCAIIGLNPSHIQYLYDKYSIYVPNYKFSPKFKRRIWDGKLHYFQKQGKTYMFFLEEIIPFLIRWEYKIQIKDLRNYATFEVPSIDKTYFSNFLLDDEPIILRWYQEEAINELIKYGNGIVIAGTGSGKTLINAVIVDLYGKHGLKTITIVPNTDLITRTREEFENVGLDHGEYSGYEKNTNPLHIVSTWQALQNNPSIMTMFQVVVVDECHGIKAQVLKTLLNEAGKNIPYRFGLTATLPKEETNKLTIFTAVGKIRYEIPSHILIEEGTLAELNIDIYQLSEDLHYEYEKYIKETRNITNMTYSQYKQNFFPDYEAEKYYLLNKEERIQWLATLFEILKEKGNILIYVTSIELGKRLSQMIPNSYFVHGKDKRKIREEIYNLFSDNNNVITFATVHIAGIGLNIKRIFYIAYIDIGKSFVRVIQAIGRGLRKAKDKNFVRILDISSDLKYGRRHVNQRIKYYKEAKYPYTKKKVDYIQK